MNYFLRIFVEVLEKVAARLQDLAWYIEDREYPYKEGG